MHWRGTYRVGPVERHQSAHRRGRPGRCSLSRGPCLLLPRRFLAWMSGNDCTCPCSTLVPSTTAFVSTVQQQVRIIGVVLTVV